VTNSGQTESRKQLVLPPTSLLCRVKQQTFVNTNGTLLTN